MLKEAQRWATRRPTRPSTSRASTPRTSSPSWRRSPSASRCSSTRRYTEGISKLTREDIRYAEELGYRIKLLGITKRTADGIELRVHPTLIPARSADRQRRRRDERHPGEGRRRRARRCTTAPGPAPNRRPRPSSPTWWTSTRMHDGRPRAPRAASRVPARPPVRHADPADGAKSRRPTTCACGCSTSPACSRTSRASWRTCRFRSTRWCRRSRSEGEDQVDIIMLTHLHASRRTSTRAIAQIEELPVVVGQSHAHPPRRTRKELGHSNHEPNTTPDSSTATATACRSTPATPVISLNEGNTPLIELRNLPGRIRRKVRILCEVRGAESDRLVQGPRHDDGGHQGGRGGRARRSSAPRPATPRRPRRPTPRAPASPASC